MKKRFDEGGAARDSQILKRIMYGFGTQALPYDPDTGELVDWHPLRTFSGRWRRSDDPWGPYITDEEAQAQSEKLKRSSVGVADDTLAIPTWFGKGPKASQDASEALGRLDEHLRSMGGLDEPQTLPEYGAETLGIMLGQPPISITKAKGALEAAKVAPGILSRVGHWAASVPRSVLEFLAPTIDPKLANYAAGTAAGTGLTMGLDALKPKEPPASPELPGRPDQFLENPEKFTNPLKLSDVMRDVRTGDLDPDSAAYLLDRLADKSGSDEEPEGHAKGGKVKPPDLMELRKSLEHLFTPSTTPDVEGAGVEGTGQEMVPSAPPANVPAGFPSLDELKAMAGSAAPEAGPSMLETPVSRRDVLKGIASMASPVKLDPLSLLTSAAEKNPPDELLDRLREAIAKAPEPVAKSWTVAPKLNEIWSMVAEDSDTGLFPLARHYAASIPGSTSLLSTMDRIQKILEAEPGVHDVDHPELLSASVDFENELHNLARKHGVITEDYGHPVYRDPTAILGHELEDFGGNDPDYPRPEEAPGELYRIAQEGDPEKLRAALSWKYSPEEFHNIATPENLQALIDHAQAGHSPTLTPEMILEGLTDNQWDDIYEHDAGDLQRRYGLPKSEAERLFKMIEDQLFQATKDYKPEE